VKAENTHERDKTRHRNGGRAMVAPLLVLGAGISVLVLLWWWAEPLARWLGFLEGLVRHPLGLALIIVTILVCTVFALPGGLLVWAVAPIYPPIQATLILLAGTVSGALAAYGVARTLGGGWRPDKLRDTMARVARHSDFLGQCALRVLPGYPHWAINHVAGVLKLPVMTFFMAAVVGLGVKWLVYCTAIYTATQAVIEEREVPTEYVVLLVVMAVFLVIASVLVQRRRGGTE
jgi:uncharacterized membrane protein YdjX (TVP38/TMEM64 family)